MGAVYKGTYSIDVTSNPKTLDLHFTEGPEKGNTSLGIYELDGDDWKICLSLAPGNRPSAFATKPGSGHALELLKRDTGQAKREEQQKNSASLDVDKKELMKLEGEWTMVSGAANGQQVPEDFLKNWKRVCKGNETTVTAVGQLMLKATFTLDPSKKPKTIDYTITDGPNKGKMQLGIYEFDGELVRFCFAPPGKDRPKEFASKAGDEHVLSTWKKTAR